MKESIELPNNLPEFNSKAAIWSAKTVYLAAQLMLYRENSKLEIDQILPNFNGDISASAIYLLI